MYVSATGVKSLSSPGISTFGNMHNCGGFPDCWYLAAFSTQLKEFGKSLTELFGTVTQCASADGTEACRFPYVDKTREKIIFIISILINRCHGFNTMPGCLKIAASVLQLYFFPIFCFSFPYFFPHFPRGHLHLLVIPYEVGLFLFINDCVKFLFLSKACNHLFRDTLWCLWFAAERETPVKQLHAAATWCHELSGQHVGYLSFNMASQASNTCFKRGNRQQTNKLYGGENKFSVIFPTKTHQTKPTPPWLQTLYFPLWDDHVHFPLASEKTKCVTINQA